MLAEFSYVLGNSNFKKKMMKKFISTLVISLFSVAAFAWSDVVKLTKDPEGIEEGDAVRVFTNKGHVSIPIDQQELYDFFLNTSIAKGTCLELETETENMPEYNKRTGKSNVNSAKVVACPASLGGKKVAGQQAPVQKETKSTNSIMVLTRDAMDVEYGKELHTHNGVIRLDENEDSDQTSSLFTINLEKGSCIHVTAKPGDYIKYDTKPGLSNVATIEETSCPPSLKGISTQAKNDKSLANWNFDPSGRRTDYTPIGAKAIEGLCVRPRPENKNIALYANPAREGKLVLPAHGAYEFVMIAHKALVKEELVELRYVKATGNGQLGKDGQFMAYGDIRDYVATGANQCFM